MGWAGLGIRGASGAEARARDQAMPVWRAWQSGHLSLDVTWVRSPPAVPPRCGRGPSGPLQPSAPRARARDQQGRRASRDSGSRETRAGLLGEGRQGCRWQGSAGVAGTGLWGWPRVVGDKSKGNIFIFLARAGQAVCATRCLCYLYAMYAIICNKVCRGTYNTAGKR